MTFRFLRYHQCHVTCRSMIKFVCNVTYETWRTKPWGFRNLSFPEAVESRIATLFRGRLLDRHEHSSGLNFIHYEYNRWRKHSYYRNLSGCKANLPMFIPSLKNSNFKRNEIFPVPYNGVCLSLCPIRSTIRIHSSIHSVPNPWLSDHSLHVGAPQ